MKSFYSWGSVILAPIALIALVLMGFEVKEFNTACNDYGYQLTDCWGEMLK